MPGASVFRVVLGTYPHQRTTHYVVADTPEQARVAARTVPVVGRRQSDLFVQLVEWLGPAVFPPEPKRKGRKK